MKINLLLIGIVLLALLIRLFHLDTAVLWIDEHQSLLEANGFGYQPPFPLDEAFSKLDFEKEKTISHVAHAVVERDSGNGIFYAIVIYGWTSFTNNSAFYLRLASVVFSVLTVIVVFQIGYELTNRVGAGYASAILFSTHHMSVLYAQEARSYAAAIFFITFSTFLFFRVVQSSRKSNWMIVAGYGVCSGLALLSHYFTFYILLAQIVVAIFFYRHWLVWRKLIIAGSIAGGILLSWMILGGMEGLDMMGFRNERYLALSNRDPQNIFYGRTDFKTIFAGLSQLFTHLFGIGFQNIGWRIRETLPILILPALLIFLNRRFLLEGKALMTSLALFILAAPLVATLMAFVSGHTVAYQVLYASFSVPFGCILMGILSDKIIQTGKPMTRIILFLFVGVMILSAWTNINSIRHGYSSEISLPDRAKSIEKKYHQGDTLRFSSVDEALLMNLYFEKKDMLQIVHSDSLYTKYPSDRVVRKVYSPLP